MALLSQIAAITNTSLRLYVELVMDLNLDELSLNGKLTPCLKKEITISKQIWIKVTF